MLKRRGSLRGTCPLLLGPVLWRETNSSAGPTFSERNLVGGRPSEEGRKQLNSRKLPDGRGRPAENISSGIGSVGRSVGLRIPTLGTSFKVRRPLFLFPPSTSLLRVMKFYGPIANSSTSSYPPLSSRTSNGRKEGRERETFVRIIV